MKSSQQQLDLSSDRVCGQSGTSIDHLECPICHKLLWKPVACETCETTFCTTCIKQWLIKSPNQCPNRCEPYVERKCPPLTAKLLGQLQVSCSYQPYGCREIVPYEALEKHESECDYQPRQCSGCRCQISKKDYDNHVNECTLIEFVCNDCKISYKRDEANIKHTESKCLKEQLRQLRDDCKEMRVILHCVVFTITFDDLPHVTEPSHFPEFYCGLKWTQFYYSNKSHVIEKRPNSGYVTSYVPDVSPHLVWSCKQSKINSETLDDTFALISLTTYAAWNDNLKLTIRGYRNYTQTNICNITLLFGKPQRILLGWKDLDQVLFEPSGGDPHPDSGRSFSSLHFVLNQLMIY